MKTTIFTKITAVVLSVAILALSVLTLALPRKSYSENENRVLAEFPTFSFNALFSGKYVSQLESYIQDHFAFRDFFIENKAETELLSGKDGNNNVYITSDGHFILEFNEPTEAEIKRRADKINDFLSKLSGVNTFLTLVPTSNSINGDLLPSDRPDGDEEKVINEIYALVDSINVSLSNALSSANKLSEQYFKTDHHWNSLGAYTAYLELSNFLGFTPTPIEEFEKVVINDFYGTTYSKSGLYSGSGEDFVIYKNNNKLSVEYVFSGITADTLYDDSYLSKKDKYSYYFGGNQPLIKITNENADTDRSLLVVKDSYANSLIPYLTNNFKTIYVVDLRFYNERVSEFVVKNGITDVLILYNIDGFVTDTGINKLS